jgi:hypothetical protein
MRAKATRAKATRAKATRAKATRAKAKATRARATRKYNNTKYHRKKGRKSTRKKQRRRSHKGGMPPRRGRAKAKEDAEAEHVDEPADAEHVVDPADAEPRSPPPLVPASPVDIPPSPGLPKKQLDARELLKAELRGVPHIFRDHYLKSEDQKAKELQDFKDTQTAAQKRFAYEKGISSAKTQMALQWAMKSPEEKERIYQEYKKQQDDAKKK